MRYFRKFILLPAAAILAAISVFAQQEPEQVLTLTLKQAIELARQQSPDIIWVRHNFRSSYWNYIYHKANYKPSLIFSSNPNFNHSINAITLPDGKLQYVNQNYLTTNARLYIFQNIALTGGTLSLQTSLDRIDQLDDKSLFYRSSPLILTYDQALFGYNSLKWNKKIAPLGFEAAKRYYVEMTEYVSQMAAARFFSLAKAQINLEIAQTNYKNADMQFTVAQGRYDIGSITENEMLRLEISKLSGETELLNAGLSVDNDMQNLRSYLGIINSIPIRVIIDYSLPLETISPEKAMECAMENSTEVISFQQRKLQSESGVAYAKAITGLQANLHMQIGMSQRGADIPTAYRDPMNTQYATVGITLPILDWGKSKGQVQMAKSRRDMELAQIEQEQNNFEMNVFRLVKQFNLQSNRLYIASITDEKAERNNEVTQQLYLLDRVLINDLNAAITAKDQAKRDYIQSLSEYWNLYYYLRSVTLFDFEKDMPLTEDYENLIK